MSAIINLPVMDRPRERLCSFGVGSLSVQELLSIILAQGGKKDSVSSIVNSLLSSFKNLERLSLAGVEELLRVKGVGYAKAAQIKAAFELGKRAQLELSQPGSDHVFNTFDAYKLAANSFKNFKKETLILFCLDSRLRLINQPQVISVGTLDASLVHPREIFLEAIKSYASRIILAHNHPSGESLPSDGDLEVTKQVSDAGHIMGVPLLDHLVIGSGEYTSIREYSPEVFS